MSEQPDTRVYEQDQANATIRQPGPSTDRRYVLCVQRGGVYAVAFTDGWIPTHAVGPFQGEQLSIAPANQDWSTPQDARTWNAATLVPLCEPERQRMMAGMSRLSKAVNASGKRAMAARPITEAPVLERVRAEAQAATGEAGASEA